MTLSIGHIVPLERENRWTDLLAVLIEADPAAAASLLGLDHEPHRVSARREAGALGDRIDLLLDVDDTLRTVVEVKVLSGLGADQLRRYRESHPQALHHILIFPSRLTSDIVAETGWRGVTWEELLGAFAGSERAWVAETAQAWLGYLERSMPKVHAHTRWNDLHDGDDFVIALRARMSWVFGELRPPDSITHDLVSSSAGRSSVARMYLDTTVPHYQVIMEAEENLPVRNYPKTVTASSRPPRGPSIKVCLLQKNDDYTSFTFDWDYLLSLWPLMAAARNDWVRTSARPRARHDREGWQAMVDKGGPRYLGIGFGDAQAKKAGVCMFGARVQLPADVELIDVVAELNKMAGLMLDMAAGPQANR